MQYPIDIKELWNT